MIRFPNAKPAYSIGSLERALLILESLAENAELTLTDLVAVVGASKGTVFRHLKVLEDRGYVVITPGTKRYRLGPKLLELGHAAHQQLGLPQIAHPAMRDLRDRFNETVHLAVLVDGDVVHIQTVESTHALKMAAGLGERAAAHVSSLGKCLLAWAPEELVRAIAKRGLALPTENSLGTVADLVVDLARVRERGYALDDEESGLGIRCVGAPIRGTDGTVIAAISMSGPANRIASDRVPELVPHLLEAAGQISSRCGWNPSGQAN